MCSFVNVFALQTYNAVRFMMHLHLLADWHHNRNDMPVITKFGRSWQNVEEQGLTSHQT